MLDYTPSNWFWTVAGDKSKFWSSAEAAYITDIPVNSGVTNISSENELWDVLREQFPKGLPTDKQSVLKSIVMARLISAGMMTQAYQGLTANPIYFARWFAPDRPDVDCNDPDAVTFVKALGLDPAVILAP